MTQNGRTESDEGPGNFIEDRVSEDLKSDTDLARSGVVTRFPPEPNGYLHIGHAKSIVVNFGLAAQHGGRCHLRFDDTNPTTEDPEYVDAIESDIRWLGYTWAGPVRHASDYFEQLYEWARRLITKGSAYVDSQSEEQIREGRGDFYRPGVESPYRDRSPEENLDLFTRMRAGEFEEGAHVLRAKIDMASKDLKLRDPLMYRIRRLPHHRTGDQWSIYPFYDWAHGQSDAIEGVTHSICTLEFQNHRALYDWFLRELEIENPPRQIEFARLNLSFTVTHKRVVQQLIDAGRVAGWDDPRLHTLAGLRRRGYTPRSVVSFCERIGVSRRDGVVDVGLLEHEVREDLNRHSPRAMVVLNPLRVVLENFESGRVETIDAPFHPEDPSHGSRPVFLTRELWVERDDFMEEPLRKWFRLAPGREVRLRYGCLITCESVVKDSSGEISELRCRWDPASLGGTAPDGRRVKGTLHWVPAPRSQPCEVRLYDRLFEVEDPMKQREGTTFMDHLNPDSIQVVREAQMEPSLAEVTPGSRWQFERLGYFVADSATGDDGRPVFNRTISLKDTWAKVAKKVRR